MAMRFPAQTGSWKVREEEWDKEMLLLKLKESIGRIHANQNYMGLLLSGGVDSALIALLAKDSWPEFPCFTIGSSYNHPDIVAAMRLAKEKDLDLHVYIPSKTTSFDRVFTGDEAVYLALWCARHFTPNVLAGDGIDEQMGGYWGHIETQGHFLDRVFKKFWDELESRHLIPMFASAQKTDVNVWWPYLDPNVVDYISRIPLQDRVRDGKRKRILKEVALMAGVPEWIIQRTKRGFCDALS